MKVRRDELTVQAQSVVEWMLTALAEQRLIPGFVESYAKVHQRPELLESAVRYRELILVLTREALLTMSSRVCAEFPRHFSGPKPGRRKQSDPAAGEAAEAFREEYFLHLAKVMRWKPEELEEFYGDFELYQMIAAREVAAHGSGRKKARPAGADAGPFADRSALLLDPSLMEKARQAAAKFQPGLHALASKVLARSFRFIRGSK